MRGHYVQAFVSKRGTQHHPSITSPIQAAHHMSACRPGKAVFFYPKGHIKLLPLERPACSMVQYAYDTYMLANSTAKALTQPGRKTWYFLFESYRSR